MGSEEMSDEDDFLDNTLFPLKPFESDEDDYEDDDEVYDVLNMQFYGEEINLDDEDDVDVDDDDIEDIQDELELEFGVPVPDDVDLDEDSTEDSSEEEDFVEGPVDEDLKRRRQEWLERHMRGNGRSWKENFREKQKQWKRR